MRITYVRHSCFTVELNKTVLIFDYYMGKISDFAKDSHIFVFVSHKHGDHFNPQIFELTGLYENIHFILSGDMKMNDKYMDTLKIPLGARDKIRYIAKNKEMILENLFIRTLKSTDEGVAFIVETEGVKLYHAGDLNWWSWKGESEEEYNDMTKRFKEEMKKIQGEHLDVAFVPLDYRQEDRFWWGFDYFMKNTDSDRVFPMHFWNHYSIIKKFLQMDCAQEYKDKIMVITKKEESFNI